MKRCLVHCEPWLIPSRKCLRPLYKVTVCPLHVALLACGEKTDDDGDDA